MVFVIDMCQVKCVDVVVVIIDYKYEEGNFELDVGIIFEVGVVWVWNILVVMVQFYFDNEFNLMLVCFYIVMFIGDQIEEGLVIYDFNNFLIYWIDMKVF